MSSVLLYVLLRNSLRQTSSKMHKRNTIRLLSSMHVPSPILILLGLLPFLLSLAYAAC